MASMPVSRSNSNRAGVTKLGGLAGVVICLSATIPLSVAAATTYHSADHHQRQANLTVAHWRDAKYDQYLRNYPNGNSMSLAQYVDHLSLPEPFECGVGKQSSCHISPLGQPLEGPDWYILSAVGQWNFYTNSLVHALKKSAGLAQAVVHEVLTDFAHGYDSQTSTGLLTEADLLNILFSPLEAGGNDDPTVSEETRESDWIAAIKPIAQGVALDSSQSLKKSTEAVRYTRMKRHLSASTANPTIEAPLIIFNSSQPVETNLHGLSQQLQGMLEQSIENKINSPISLETGIYSALEHGRFISPHVAPARLANNAATSLSTLSAFLNQQNAMIVVRNSDCNNYREEIENNKSRLAFCSSDNTLIEVLLVTGGDKYTREITNAHLIRDKYGFKTSFLASEALRCEKSIDNHGKTPEHVDDIDSPYEACTFHLPICNLKDEYYQNLLDESGNLVRICREAVGVPI